MRPVTAIALILTAIAAPAITPRHRAAQVRVDSVSCRDDLSRVYCKIIGRPHTSDRIDGATLTVNGITLTATDIDGVDFKRYFQWEDDGIIPLEIDFPPIPNATGVLSLKMPRGDVSTNL